MEFIPNNPQTLAWTVTYYLLPLNFIALVLRLLDDNCNYGAYYRCATIKGIRFAA